MENRLSRMEESSSRDSYQRDNQDEIADQNIRSSKELPVMLQESRQSSQLASLVPETKGQASDVPNQRMLRESQNPVPSQVEIGVNRTKNKNESEGQPRNNVSGHTNHTPSQISGSNTKLSMEDANIMFNKSRYVGGSALYSTGFDGKLADRKMMQTQKVAGEGSNRKLSVQVKQQIAKRNAKQESLKATTGSQLPNGAELLKLSDQLKNEAGTKQFAHLQLQRKGHVTAQNFQKPKNFVVNEYGQDVASHHFSTKVKNNRKNTGSRSRIPQLNQIQGLSRQANKSALLKHPTAGAQYQLYRNKDNQSQLSSKRGGLMSSSPSNREKQLDRSISVDEFNSGISGIPGIVPLNKSNFDQNSQMYSTQVNYGFIQNTYGNMKRPISMGNFPGSKNRDSKGGHRTTNRQSGNLLRAGDLMKSHQSLLYNGPKDAYQMQQQIEAQQQQIQYLTQLNERILENRYHSSLSQIDIRGDHQLENHITSNKQISENQNVKINDLIQNQGYQSAKQQFFQKITDAQGSDTNSQTMLQRSQQSNIFTANTLNNEMNQTKKMENTIGASTEADINSLLNPDRQSSSRNLEIGNQFFNKRNFTQDNDPKTAFRVRNDVEELKRSPSDEGEDGLKAPETLAQAVGQEVAQIIDEQKSRRREASTDPKLSKRITDNPQHLASLREFQDAQLLKAQIMNGVTFAGGLDKPSSIEEQQKRYKSVENNDKSQFININNVNVINVNSTNATEANADFMIGSAAQNIFDQRVPTIEHSGREEMLHSRSQNRLATDSFFNSKRQMETAPSIFQSHSVSHHQGPSRMAQKKSGGQDISLVRKEWRKFKIMLDNQEYHLLNVAHDKQHKEKSDPNGSDRYSDGLGNLALLIDQPSIPKLPELKSILQSLQTQILRQFQKQKRDSDIIHDQMLKNCSRKDKEYQNLLKHCHELQDKLQEDQESLGRFLKKENKGQILDQISEYEALGKLDPEETMDIESYEYKLARKLKEEMHRQTHKYSECRRNLKEMDYLLSLSGGTAGLQGVGGVMKEDEEYDAIVQTIEESLTKSFQGFQMVTAKKVLERCLKRVISVDQGTQMGHDMFTEERLKFQDRISELETELEDLDAQVNLGWKEIDQLKKEKVSQSQQIQDLKQKLKDAEFMHKEQAMKFLEQNLRLNQLEDMAGTKIQHLQDIEAEKAELKSLAANYKSSVEHLQDSLAQKRSKKRAYKQQVMNLQQQLKAIELESKTSTARPVASTAGRGGVSSSDYEEVQHKLRIARQRLGQGLRRHVRQVKRAQAKEKNDDQRAKAGDAREGDSGDLTDESYYEHPSAPKETQCAATTTEDLANYHVEDSKRSLKDDATRKNDDHGIDRDDSRGRDSAPKQVSNELHLQFLDLLSHEIYIQVMQTAGAIPRGKAFQTMTEEAARESIARWYRTAITKKLQEQQSEKNPEVIAQRKLSRRLRKASLGLEHERKKATGPNTINEAAIQGRDDSHSDSSVDEANKAEQLATEEFSKKAIHMISEDLISRVRMMRAQLAAKTNEAVDESENEGSETKEQKLTRQDKGYQQRKIQGKSNNAFSSKDESVKNRQTGISFQNTPGASEHLQAQQAQLSKQEASRPRDELELQEEANEHLTAGQSSMSTPGQAISNVRNSQFNPIQRENKMESNKLKEQSSQERFAYRYSSQGTAVGPNVSQFNMEYYDDSARRENSRLPFSRRPLMTNAATSTSGLAPSTDVSSTQTQEAYFPLDERTRNAIQNILGNKLSKSSDNLSQIAHCFQSYFNRMHMEGQFQRHGDPAATKRFYPSYEPKQKKYERIPLNYRKKQARDVDGSGENVADGAGGSKGPRAVSAPKRGQHGPYRRGEGAATKTAVPGPRSGDGTLLHSQSQSALKSGLQHPTPNQDQRTLPNPSQEEEDQVYRVPEFQIQIKGDSIHESAELNANDGRYAGGTQKTTLNKKSL